MKTDEESASRTSNGADQAPPRKKKRFPHIHIGPHAKAYRRGLALCPICDAERIHKTPEAKSRHF